MRDFYVSVRQVIRNPHLCRTASLPLDIPIAIVIPNTDRN